MLANWITLSRFPLLLLSLWAIYLGSPMVQLAGAGLLFFGLLLDTVDGMVARRRGETSLLGGVLDIAADRAYELLLWVSFALLGMVPVMMPLIVLTRTTLTDALRTVGVTRGTAPFDQPSSALARFLVASPVMRIGYSAGKITTFCGLALGRAFSGSPADTALGRAAAPMLAGLQVVAWLTVGICVLRGLPVIMQSLRQLGGAPQRALITTSAARQAREDRR